MTEQEDFDDGTTSFGDAPVDGLVFLPPGDSPELRMKPRPAPAPVSSMSTRPSAPPAHRFDPAPTAPWTPGPAPETGEAKTRWVWQRWGKSSRIAAATVLASLPLLAALWLIYLGKSLVGG